MSTHQSPSAQSPPPSKSRRKRSADVVSFEDLLAAHKTERGPGQLPAEGVVLIGVDFELQRRMAERVGQAAQEQSVLLTAASTAIGAPIFGAPPVTAEKDSSIEPSSVTYDYQQHTELNARQHSPQRTADHEEVPNIGAPNNTAPTSGAPYFDVRELLVRRSGTKTYTVHSVSRIEDVFTASERDLLRWLWERGRQVPHTPKIRLVTGPNGEGARRLATQCGLIYNTFKNLTHSLSTKFAVEIVKPERNLPTIYAVFHYSTILERQRQAGFSGAVHKNGGGRELVDTQACPAPRRPDLTVDQLQSLFGAPNLSALNIATGAPNFGAVSAIFGAPNFGAPIRSKEYTSEKENTSSSSTPANSGAPMFVIDALFQRTGRTDVDAARMITKGCLEANPTVQPQEIARLIRTAQIPPNIANPVGLLIRALPGRCAPESLSNYRESWRQEAEDARRGQEQERAQSLETARSILDGIAQGEDWDPATVEWARNLLSSDGAITADKVRESASTGPSL